MALEVFVSKRANNQFIKISSFLEKEWGYSSAQKFVHKVEAFIELLPQFPEIGIIHDEKRQIFRRVIVKQVTVYYRISENNITLLSLFDTRQDSKKKKF